MEKPSAEERLNLFFAIPMPSPWQLDSSQGYLFASMGVFKTALSIFTRRELWDEAISCMVQIGDSKAALERIGLELEKYPSNPKLWCILGDLNDNLADYEKAWEVSGRRFGRAQRAIGNWNFKKENWAEAIVAFETSLSLNPLYTKTWFLLGCASLQVNDLQKALKSFSRVVALDSENAEAWNNIAAIHIRQDRPKDALQAFKEAARLDYDNWKIFENYFEVALAAGELLIATQALRRSAEIREKSFELKNLQRLVRFFAEAVRLMGVQSLDVLSVKRRIESLAKEVLSVHHPSSPDLWLILSKLHQLFNDLPAQSVNLFKAYRAAKSKGNHDKEQISKYLEIVRELAEVIVKRRDADELFQLSLIVPEAIGLAGKTFGPESQQASTLLPFLDN